MVSAAPPLPSVRPLVLPAEHGAWGLLLEPVLLGLLVAPSAAGALIALAVMAAFLGRHPLKLAGQDWLRRKRYPRTAVCELLAATNLIAASLAFAAAWKLAGWMPLAALVPAIPLAAIQFGHDVQMRGRNVAAELCGAAAPAAAAAAIALGGGVPLAGSATLAILMICRAVPSVLFVRSAIDPHGTLRASLSRERERIVSVAAHGMAVAVAALVGPLSAVAAMVMLMVRSLLPTRGLRAQTIGLREIVFGVVTVLLIAAGLYRG